MDKKNAHITSLKERWEFLLGKLSIMLGEPPDLQGVIYLIGVQELGKGFLKFSKDQKQDLMHIATCKLLSYSGYYVLEGEDLDGWPHWKPVKEIPKLSLKEQDWMLKEAAITYFEEIEFI
ncbi:MAG: hypothetical protein IPJ79_03320 [Bacteroidetes bacterium]|nr:hypothetical protein [Bacteroidota bacterium]